ncbi:MAG: flippase [Candidatus Scalindua sp.]|nr:flippase [Planctomycetota bacterium]GJQ59818.1 MAG: flippase [Candidatus Scalindua sp.]
MNFMDKKNSEENISKLDLRSGVRRITTNAASILASDISNRITTFVIYIFVARFLGALQFGQLALALNLFNTFQIISVAGLKSFVIREVAKNHDKTEKFLVNASFVVSLTSIISITILGIFVWIMEYSSAMSFTIIILSLGLIPFTLSHICDSLFQAQEKMQYITYSNLAVNVLKLSSVFLLLWTGGSLKQLIFLLFFSHIINLFLKLWFLLKQINRTGERVDLRYCLNMTKASFTFLGIDGVCAVMNCFNIILLSKFTGELGVGIYCAASQLMVPIALLFESVAVSVYPAMCRSFEAGIEKLELRSARVLEVLLAVVLPTTVALFFFADSLFLLIYGNKNFSQSTVVLQIIVWGLIFRAISKVLGIALIASLKEKVTLQILLINMFTMFVSGFILISRYGVVGGALTTLIVSGVNFVQHYVHTTRILSSLSLPHMFWKPAIAVTTMAIMFFSFPELNIFVRGIIGSLIYLIVFAIILFITIGNLDQLKVRYLTLKVE